MLADKETVHKLIPQEKPMIMVDTLLEHDDERSLTGFEVKRDNLFVEEGNFIEAGLLENMAQSAALRTGWIGKEKAEEAGEYQPPVGVIGAVKNFVLHQMPKAGDHLQTEIKLIASFGSATVVEANVRSDNTLCAEAELKIFIQEKR